MPKSLLDHAYEYLCNKPESVSFQEMWNYIKDAAELTEEQAANKVSSLYTNLMLDGRFVTLGDNQWDLRVRHTFDKVHIDMKDVYTEVETADDDEEDEEDEKEYNQAFEEEKPASENGDEDDDAPIAEETDVDEEETL